MIGAHRYVLPSTAASILAPAHRSGGDTKDPSMMMSSPSSAQAYLRQLDALLKQIAPTLLRRSRLERKRFFSGGAVYADGRIFMTLTAVGLALKLPEDARTARLPQGGMPLGYFAKRHVKQQYMAVPEGTAKYRT